MNSTIAPPQLDLTPRLFGDRACLHHIGFVVASIERSIPSFVSVLGMQLDTDIFEDPIQDARVAFLRHSSNGLPVIELVEPASAKSHLHGFLKRGGGLHHLCYEVEGLEVQLEAMLRSRAVLVREPAPAVAFGGRRIAWICTRERLLVELLERQPSC